MSMHLFALYFVLSVSAILPYTGFAMDDKEAVMYKADELLNAKLPAQAAVYYLDVLEQDPLDSVAKLQLAKAYIQMEQFANALAILEDNLKEPSFEDTYFYSIYLTATAHKGLKQYDQAKLLFSRYLSEGNAAVLHTPPVQLPYLDEARFENGMVSFLCADYASAKNEWEMLSTSKSRLMALKYIYLVRMALMQNRPAEASILIAEQIPPIEKSLETHDILHYEFAYLKGQTAFHQRDFTVAVQYFEKCLPTARPAKCAWYQDALYHLGCCSLKIGENKAILPERQADLFKKAEEYFLLALAVQPDEKIYLALGQCYLASGSQLNDVSAYSKAEALLSNSNFFISREAKAHALLLRAEAAPTYSLRERLYRQLTQENHKESSFYGKGWYLRAWNAFEEGQNLFKQGDHEKALAILDKASTAFSKAHALLQHTDPVGAASATKYQAIAIGYHDNEEANKLAFDLLSRLTPEETQTLFDNPDEIYYLRGFYAGRLVHQIQSEKNIYRQLAEQSLWHAANLTPKSAFEDVALCHLGAFYYNDGRYAEAETAYLNLVDSFPDSPLAGEALFWAARCADEIGQAEEGRERRQKVFVNFPNSPFSAEAFFTLYSPQEYLQGDRLAIKHLQSFIEKYGHTHLLLKAYYWLGLDNKRDRKTVEGKWVRKKNLTEAINAFYQVEQQFDSFAEKGLIPAESLQYYLIMRYRAMLERAQANLAIADESQGAKRRIYLEYARDLFKVLCDKFNKSGDPHILLLSQGEVYPSLLEEASLCLAQTVIKEGDDEAAEQILARMMERYKDAKITRGYYLSRGWYKLGSIAMRRKDYATALANFKKSQETAKGNVLSTDQRLDLFIQESMCYRGLHEWDNAILILSKVVNDDAISSLRLKAMYLRAEVYELQGRPELARKQLDFMVNKGGPWAAQAKEKLENEYGY